MEGADDDAPATVGSGNVVPDTARMVIGGGLEPRAPARAQTIENEVMGSARSGLESETLTSEMAEAGTAEEPPEVAFGRKIAGLQEPPSRCAPASGLR